MKFAPLDTFRGCGSASKLLWARVLRNANSQVENFRRLGASTKERSQTASQMIGNPGSSMTPDYKRNVDTARSPDMP